MPGYQSIRRKTFETMPNHARIARTNEAYIRTGASQRKVHRLTWTLAAVLDGKKWKNGVVVSGLPIIGETKLIERSCLALNARRPYLSLVFTLRFNQAASVSEDPKNYLTWIRDGSR